MSIYLRTLSDLLVDQGEPGIARGVRTTVGPGLIQYLESIRRCYSHSCPDIARLADNICNMLLDS
jgi:hypothetical protein